MTPLQCHKGTCLPCSGYCVCVWVCVCVCIVVFATFQVISTVTPESATCNYTCIFYLHSRLCNQPTPIKVNRERSKLILSTHLNPGESQTWFQNHVYKLRTVKTTSKNNLYKWFRLETSATATYAIVHACNYNGNVWRQLILIRIIIIHYYNPVCT